MTAAKSTIVAISDPAQRNRLAAFVDSLPDFRVISCTADLMNTYNEVEISLPKAVLISSRLAALPEFEVMRGLFSALDVRWLVVTEPNHAFGLRRPVSAGSPSGSDLFAVPENAAPQIIANQLRSLTRTETPFSRPELPGRSPLPAPITNFRTAASNHRLPEKVILIGSSTGGVDALISILSAFPVDCPPTVIVQHTGAGFGESLASLLDRQCSARVTLSAGRQVLQRGTILIGAGTKTHLVLETGDKIYACPQEGTPVSGHLPSVDVMFESAVGLAPRVSAALLTGMGRDGASGLRKLKDAGAHTIAQDEATSVVFGMPRAAVELDAAHAVLPLNRIGTALLTPARAKQRVHP
ncbi:CheB methylesterase domain-containing protein [Primorskyibacter sp. 2E107]|uniref:CheB methylesterase domain-containing protein n=1 Tax=Primorskyibacter sp. 2E107 TaxID=3403458 RepID=UPI003AF98B84